MQKETVIIIGGGLRISGRNFVAKGRINPLVIEKNIVNAIYNYPTHQTFFF